MQRHLLLIISSLLFQSAMAQNRPLDSLKIALAKFAVQPVSLKRDSLVVKTIRNIWVQLPMENDKQRKLYKDSLERFVEKSTWTKSNAHLYYVMALTHVYNGEHLLAFDDIDKSLQAFKKYHDEANYLQANDILIVIIGWNLVENSVNDANIKEKYLNYLSEGLAMAKAKRDTAIWANIENVTGQYYLTNQNYQEAYRHYEVAEKITQKDINKYFVYHYSGLGAKGLCLLYLNQEKKGKEIIDRVISICQREKNQDNEEKFILSQAGSIVGKYYIEKKDYKNALKTALIGKAATDFLQFPLYSYLLNKVFYQAYKGLNQPMEAFKYLEKIKQYEDKAEIKKLSENYAEWQLKYENEKQKNQIKTLENNKLKQENERKDLMRNWLIATLFAGFSLTGYVFWNNKKLTIKNEELKKKNDEISAAMIKGQTLERQRVASELHDNLNTKIVALKWRFEALMATQYSEIDAKILEDFTKGLDDIYTDVRLISHNLLPTELVTRGIVPALQKLILSVSNKHLKVHFLTEGIEKRLDKKLEFELYNITLELINNILKHANATQAWVSITQHNDLITLTVSDNGKGIELGKETDGVGLRNIDSRVENLKGRLQISRQNTHGTIVQIDVNG